MQEMSRNKVTEPIIGSAIKVHKTFGPGLLTCFVKALCTVVCFKM